jgi:hypothetical protein
MDGEDLTIAEAEAASVLGIKMERVDDRLGATLTSKAGRHSCIAHRFLRALGRSILPFLEDCTISCTINWLNSIRCWKCSLTLCVPSWPLNSTHNKLTRYAQPRCMLMQWLKLKLKIVDPMV